MEGFEIESNYCEVYITICVLKSKNGFSGACDSDTYCQSMLNLSYHL